MLKQVTLALNNLEPDTWTRHEVEDIRDFLMTQFDKFPENARIYHVSVSDVNDITPYNDADIERLGTLPGPFFVIVFPEGPLGWLAVGFFVAAAAFVLLAPAPPVPPTPLTRNSQAPSPNNELSNRTNSARINGRIPDIFGTVRSTPDLIATPYKIFENGREVEYSYMCIGRGPYDISDIRDGETLCENIPGTSILVYPPYVSPNGFDPNNAELNQPQLVIGTAIKVPVLSAKRSNSVNGQVLRPSNPQVFEGAGNVRFKFPNLIELPVGSPEDFTKYFVEGDELTITGASMTAAVAVTESISCRVTMQDVFVKYQLFTNLSVTHTWDTGDDNFDNNTDGSLIFEVDYNSLQGGIFSAGHEITLDGGTVSGINLDGTYTVLSSFIEGPSNAGETKVGVPTLFIVKLTNPRTVNVNWEDVHSSQLDPVFLLPRRELNYALQATFDIILSPASSYDLDLNGTYTIVSVTKETIVLSNPNAVNSDWNDVLSVQIQTPLLSPTLSATGEKWVGPFILEDPDLNRVFCNFVASNGLYKDDGIDQIAAIVDVQLEVAPVDENDDPIQGPEIFNIQLIGSNILKETIAITLKAQLSSFNGRCSIRARRVSESDLDFEGTVVDEVRWRDAYSIAPVEFSDFGNITTIQAVTFATASALALKERKLNLLVTRKIPIYVAGIFSGTLQATTDSTLILAAICRDRYIGNRADNQFDMQNFIDVAAEVEDYFGSPVCRQFSYTFDKDNLSFEETIGAVANAMFCVAYRRGSVIRLSFEKKTEDSVLLFNHRNKIPKTEVRSFTFGNNQSNDGVNYIYVDPADDSINTIFLPEIYAAVNPKKVESVGVRSHLHAYFHAWRIWNKIRYQNTTIQFDACQEADLLINNDRILISDGTRSNSQEGEVIAVDGTELTLSQNVDITTDTPYTIFLQHVDGTVEGIQCTPGTDDNQVVLAEAPAIALVTDEEKSVRTGFIIVGNTDPKQMAFLVSEKSPAENMVSTVKGFNYDERYYSNDPDFINGEVDGNGYGSGGGFYPGSGSAYGSGDIGDGVDVGNVAGFMGPVNSITAYNVFGVAAGTDIVLTNDNLDLSGLPDSNVIIAVAFAAILSENTPPSGMTYDGVDGVIYTKSSVFIEGSYWITGFALFEFEGGPDTDKTLHFNWPDADSHNIRIWATGIFPADITASLDVDGVTSDNNATPGGISGQQGDMLIGIGWTQGNSSNFPDAWQQTSSSFLGDDGFAAGISNYGAEGFPNFIPLGMYDPQLVEIYTTGNPSITMMIRIKAVLPEPDIGGPEVAIPIVLIHGNGELTDTSSLEHVLTFEGTASITAVDPRFGSGCIDFDTAEEDGKVIVTELDIEEDGEFDFSTRNWTIEAWVYYDPPGVDDFSNVFYLGRETTGYVPIVDFYLNDGILNAYGENGSGVEIFNIVAAAPIAEVTWVHLALVRSEGTILMFANGILKGTDTCTDLAFTETKLVVIGSDNDVSQMKGKLDEVRISHNAVYVDNFIPQSSEFLDP